MSSGPAPSVTYSNFVELTPQDATTFVVGNVLEGGRFTVSDAAQNGSSDNTGVVGDVPNELVTVIEADGSQYRTDQTYWGKLPNDGGLVTRFPSRRSVDGFSYVLYTNRQFNSLETLERSDFQQTAFALCFSSGTRILTMRGEVAVEDLRVGDRAITATGEARTVTWTGHRRLGTDRPMPADQAPVRIRSGAFGHGLPTRDLLLSPGHPVLVDAEADGRGGVLVPVMCLVNGTTIARTKATQVTYWHVELDTHDILLAEGLPAESFLDFGCRPFFAEASDHALHNPDFVVPGLSARCRPVAVDGPIVDAERARLDAHFARTLAADCAWGETVDSLAPAA
jgi:hypothetical protein